MSTIITIADYLAQNIELKLREILLKITTNRYFDRTDFLSDYCIDNFEPIHVVINKIIHSKNNCVKRIIFKNNYRNTDSLKILNLNYPSNFFI